MPGKTPRDDSGEILGIFSCTNAEISEVMPEKISECLKELLEKWLKEYDFLK